MACSGATTQGRIMKAGLTVYACALIGPRHLMIPALGHQMRGSSAAPATGWLLTGAARVRCSPSIIHDMRGHVPTPAVRNPLSRPGGPQCVSWF